MSQRSVFGDPSPRTLATSAAAARVGQEAHRDAKEEEDHQQHNPVPCLAHYRRRFPPSHFTQVSHAALHVIQPDLGGQGRCRRRIAVQAVAAAVAAAVAEAHCGHIAWWRTRIGDCC